MRELVVLLFLLLSPAYSIDPPEIEWEVLYGYSFNCVRETSDGNLILTGWRQYNYPRTIFLYSTDGTKIWESSVYPDNAVSRAVVETPDGGFVATGYGVPEAGSTHYSLSLYKVSAEGDAIWSKLYMLPDGVRGYGNNLTLLPDGGMAVCGRKDPPEGMDQAWILRTDSQGDTLWTREWGWVYNDAAMSILYIEDGLTVLMQGNTPSTPGGPHLVRYDMDGNLLWEMQLDFPGGVTCFAQQMCRASDGGLLVLDNYHPEIAHYDLQGNFDWYFAPPGVGEPWGWSVSTTMDGGILFGGECADNPERKGICGMISRHNADGMELWRDYVYNSGCDIIYSAIQLSQGGYIAAGQANGQGYLIKYAPEMGIEETTPSAGIEMSVFPNPCSSELSVIFGLPEAGSASVHIYDLPGRLVSVVADGEFPSGSNTITWTVPEGLSSGCYLVRMDTSYGHITENCVLIR
jgi:hypothetical protein